MAYKALYRKYRPKSFSEVSGQNHVTKTFMNALKSESITHAYLFSGPRGTGKTSVAKIIAKAVNCVHAPVDEPCNECDICVGINNGSISDVIEIDAASNNGVDEIREIRDKVKYLPTVAKYKVYIIDEVHMLSTGAFNALLKTLEEPPQHAIFILATTEPHKIPQTILSRCQRFDFRAISTNNIVTRLKEVIAFEHIKIDEDAINIIAENSDGGLRDAISLLDQTMSYSDDIITEEDVRVITGTISVNNTIQLMDYIEAKDVYSVLNTISELLDLGKEPKKIANDLIGAYRDMLILKNAYNKKYERYIYNNKDFVRLANEIKNDKIFTNINELNECLTSMRWSENSKTILELALIKITAVIKESALKEPAVIEHKRVEKVQDEKIIKPSNDNAKTKDEEPVESIKISNDYTKTYNVEFIQKVLTEALKKDDKITKEELQIIWATMMDQNLNGDFKVAKMLSEGEIVASSNSGLILVYPNESLCNSLMTPSNKVTARKIIQKLTDLSYDFICIPKLVWMEKRNEFVEQFKKGKEIKLTPIEYNGLLDVSNIKGIDEEEKNPTIEKAINLFGEEIVEIE